MGEYAPDLSREFSREDFDEVYKDREDIVSVLDKLVRRVDLSDLETAAVLGAAVIIDKVDLFIDVVTPKFKATVRVAGIEFETIIQNECHGAATLIALDRFREAHNAPDGLVRAADVEVFAI